MKLHHAGLIVGSFMAVCATLPASALTANILSGGGTINPGINNFTFDFSSAFGPSGTFQIDDVTLDISSLDSPDSDLSTLELYLISPAASGLRALTLVNESLSGNTATNTTLSDAGSTFIDSAMLPYSGTFKPQGGAGSSFNDTPAGDTFADAFDTTDPSGIFTLRIYNKGNEATIGPTTLNITATAVPFDFQATPGLLLLGGLWGIQRHLKKRRSISIATDLKPTSDKDLTSH